MNLVKAIQTFVRNNKITRTRQELFVLCNKVVANTLPPSGSIQYFSLLLFFINRSCPLFTRSLALSELAVMLLCMQYISC